jgi:hypothetical protein
MSYDVTPAPAGVDPEKWAAHQSGACGGYYKCGICAQLISEMKLLEERAYRERADVAGPTPRRRANPTMTFGDSSRARAARREKAKAARRARKLQRRRAR